MSSSSRQSHISICDARQAVLQALPAKQKPWIKLQEPVELDESGKLLIQSLVSGEIVAIVLLSDNQEIEVPSGYWKYLKRAVATLNHGGLITSSSSASLDDFFYMPALEDLNGHQCFFERRYFDIWLALIPGSPVSLMLGKEWASSQATTEILAQNQLRLWMIIKLAGGAPDEGWDLDELWQVRYVILEDAIVSGELPATLLKKDTDIRFAAVTIADLWTFLCLKSELRSLDWLREFCWEWAEIRGDQLEQLPAQHTDIFRSGAPGRPTIMHLVFLQMQTRHKDGELCLTLASESRALKQWAKEHHPEAPQPTEKTIQNRVRQEYHRLMAASRRPK